jgi:hypothetical protein
MDWPLAISRNRTALLAIITALIRSLGLAGGGRLTTLPHFLYHRVLATLRQAESAARRLIVIAAYEMDLRGVKVRAAQRGGLDEFLFSLRPNPRFEPAIPAFRLIDPLKDFGREVADPDAFWSGDTFDEYTLNVRNSNTPNRTPVPAAALGLRLLALKNALDTIAHQAKRLARWYQQRDLALLQNQPHRLSPLRPGPPPASRRRKTTEMDGLLHECHMLAIYTRERCDSS